MYRRIDHVVVAVKDIHQAVQSYEALGLKARAVREVPALGVKVAVLPVGDGWIELAQPVGDAGPIAQFLREKGEGIYLVSLEADDLLQAHRTLKERKVALLGDKDLTPAVGRRRFHVAPASAAGATLQIIDRKA